MAAETGKNIPYRWYAFTHWANLAFLTGAAAAGVVFDPLVWFIAAPLELGALWVVSDLPPFRARIDQLEKTKDLVRERAYYLEQLWGLRPKRGTQTPTRLEWLKNLFLESDPEDVDDRVITRDTAFEEYTEMREIIAKLLDLEKVRGVTIVSNDLNRFELVINGYLRYLMACRSLSDALRGLEAPHLQKELRDLEVQLKDATGDLRSVLLERKRLRETQLERLPKLRATLELFRTRADAIVYQMRNIHGQVVADPGVDVNAFLEDTFEKHELMTNPIDDLEADQAVRDMLRSADSVNERRRNLVGLRGGIRQG